jgi:hypothetical protein
MSMSKTPKMRIQEVRYGVRLNYVIFPVDFIELRNVLAKNGYELSPVRNIPPPPIRISFVGDIARKGEIIVSIDTESCEIDVAGRSLQGVKDSFQEIAEIIRSELGISLYANVKFYSCVVHYKINTGKIPRNEIAKAENQDYIARLGRILGEDVSLFSIRLMPRGAIPNAENWFDIYIEPDILDETLYHVGVTFRNADREKTERFVSNLENNILRLIEVIEA